MKVEQFINSLGATEDEKKALLAAVGKYSTNFDAAFDEIDTLKTREAELRTQYEEKAAAYEKSLQGWQTEAEKSFQTALAAEGARINAERAAIQADIRKLAAEYALPETAIAPLVGKAPAAPTPPEPKQPTFDEGKFMTRDQFRTEADYYAKLPLLYSRLEREHTKLFGESNYPDFDKLIDFSTKNKVNLETAWKTMYNIEAKREEVRNKQFEDRLKAETEKVAKDTEARIRSEVAADNPAMVHRHSNEPFSSVLRLNQQHKPAVAPATPDPNATIPNSLRGPARLGREERVKAAAATFETEFAKANGALN